MDQWALPPWGIAAPFDYLRSVDLHIKENLDGSLKSRKTRDLRTYALLVGEETTSVDECVKGFCRGWTWDRTSSQFFTL